MFEEYTDISDINGIHLIHERNFPKGYYQYAKSEGVDGLNGMNITDEEIETFFKKMINRRIKPF